MLGTTASLFVFALGNLAQQYKHRLCNIVAFVCNLQLVGAYICALRYFDDAD